MQNLRWHPYNKQVKNFGLINITYFYSHYYCIRWCTVKNRFCTISQNLDDQNGVVTKSNVVMPHNQRNKNFMLQTLIARLNVAASIIIPFSANSPSAVTIS